MKVLQINSVCGIGSTGRIATDIHSILIEQGHESHIAYGRDLPKNCNEAIKIGTKYDQYIHFAMTRVSDKHGLGSRRATMKFINIVKKLDPDIIHLHNIHGYYLNIEVLFNFFKELNKPIVWTLHDCWSFTGHCAYFDYSKCDKWKTGCFSCPQKRRYPSSIFFDNSQSNYVIKKELFNGIKNLTIITPSKWLANLVVKSFLSEYPVNVINNGIDLKKFKPNIGNFRKLKKLENKFIILGVASVWDRRKGLKYFVELANMIADDEVIVIVGLTNKQISQIPKNIIAISKTNKIEELVDIYSSADVFVNPTLEDNFPTTNLEALACGTPIITFETGGSSECIDNKSGLNVKEKSSEYLYKNISEIKNKGKSTYVDECVKRAVEYYDKDNKYSEYISMYKQILEKEIEN